MSPPSVGFSPFSDFWLIRKPGIGPYAYRGCYRVPLSGCGVQLEPIPYQVVFCFLLLLVTMFNLTFIDPNTFLFATDLLSFSYDMLIRPANWTYTLWLHL